VVGNVDVLTQAAPLADLRTRLHVAEVPDPGALTDLAGRVDVRALVNENARKFANPLGAHLPQPYSFLNPGAPRGSAPRAPPPGAARASGSRGPTRGSGTPARSR